MTRLLNLKIALKLLNFMSGFKNGVTLSIAFCSTMFSVYIFYHLMHQFTDKLMYSKIPRNDPQQSEILC